MFHYPLQTKLFLVATGTRHIDGLRIQSFRPLEIFWVSHVFLHTQISPGGHHISHTPLALQRDICLQDVRLCVMCLSWLWIYCEIFCAEILWPELNILPCSVLQLTSAAESDICKESNAVVTMHFFPSGLRKTALQMLNSRPQCFLPVHSANILFTELHSFLDSITKGWKCVRMLQ